VRDVFVVVDIGGIVDHQCLNFCFKMLSSTDEEKQTGEKMYNWFTYSYLLIWMWTFWTCIM